VGLFYNGPEQPHGPLEENGHMPIGPEPRILATLINASDYGG